MLGITARAFNTVAMAGVKAIAYELVEQLGHAPAASTSRPAAAGCWRASGRGSPSGSGSGWPSALPRLVACSPPAATPSSRRAARAPEHVAPDRPECTSAISGLQLTNPPDGDAALAAVRASGRLDGRGRGARPLRGAAELATTHGVFVEPAAAAAYAG